VAPVWVGGNSAAARRRAVALGDGLHLIDCRPDEIPAAQTALRSALTAAGRAPDGFTLSLRRSLTTGADTLRDDAAAYARHGLDYLVVSPRRPRSVDALAVRIADLAETLLH
jgi:alkanesulfonate monooxygenase SsuD/methylene tetrahydromethanopterin reductase-like flavin-dependent oxidoreductase (luciferase family)